MLTLPQEAMPTLAPASASKAAPFFLMLFIENLPREEKSARFARPVAGEHFADDAAAEQEHAGHEDQAGDHADGFAQRVEPFDAGLLRHKVTEVAQLVFQRDNQH